MRHNLFGLLVRAASDPRKRRILRFASKNTSDLEHLTYQELLHVALQNAEHLHRICTPNTNSVVLLYLTDPLSIIKWFWSIVAAGCIPCILPPFMADVSKTLEYMRGLRALIPGARLLTSTSHMLELMEIEGFKTTIAEDLESLDSQQDIYGATGYYAAEDDIAILMLTSGSTGSPKAVRFRHGQIMHSLSGKVITHQTTRDDVFMGWVGLDHVASLVEIHLHAVSLAAEQYLALPGVLLESPLFFLSLIDFGNVTYTFAPNFFLAKVVETLEAYEETVTAARKGTEFHQAKQAFETPTLNLSSLRALISGGEANLVATCVKLTDMLQKYKARKTFIRPGFGMTETCAGAVYNSLNCPSYDVKRCEEFSSLGKCIPGVQLRILPETQKRAGVDEVGELQLKGPIIFDGYYNNPEATRLCFTYDGWFKTGDLASIDINGILHCVGREKDMIVVNGIKHPSQAIEAVIEDSSISGINPSFTVAFPHRPFGASSEALCIVYSPRFEKDDAIARYHTAVAISNATFMHFGLTPFEIIPLEAKMLQKSSLGKLSRSKIRQSYENGSYDQYLATNENLPEKITDMTVERMDTPTFKQKIILDTFEATFPGVSTKFHISSTISQIGLSSISLLQLRHNLQENLHMEIPLSVLFSNSTIFSLSTALETLRKGAAFDAVVTLQPHGTKVPLWLIHPGVGEILIFMDLARTITDRPVYALRARGFNDGEPYFRSMEEIITTYHAAIKRVQPAGPYAILGYSFGSILGFEITKILEAKGDEVKLLATLDQPPHFKERARNYDWYEVVLTIAYFLGLIGERCAYQLMGDAKKVDRRRAEVLDHIFSVAPVRRVSELGMTAIKLDNWAKLALSLKICARNYDPSGVVKRMDIFYTAPLTGLVKARNIEEWYKGYIGKWKDFVAPDGVRFHAVAGGHRTLISPPYLDGFKERLDEVISSRGV